MTEFDYTSVPPGTYLCEVDEIREGFTRSLHHRWGISLRVVDGVHAGRLIAWDALVFSHRGLPRVKQIARAFGLADVADRLVFPALTEEAENARETFRALLHGAHARVTIRFIEYPDERGNVIRRAEVPYEGYEPARIEP